MIQSQLCNLNEHFLSDSNVKLNKISDDINIIPVSPATNGTSRHGMESELTRTIVGAFFEKANLISKSSVHRDHPNKILDDNKRLQHRSSREE